MNYYFKFLLFVYYIKHFILDLMIVLIEEDLKYLEGERIVEAEKAQSASGKDRHKEVVLRISKLQGKLHTLRPKFKSLKKKVDDLEKILKPKLQQTS